MKLIRDLYLNLTVFVTGAMILVVEILGSRILMPFYGSTIYVWSSLIAVTMAALAIGYWTGGRLADRRPQAGWLYGVIALAAIAVALIPFAVKSVLLFSDRFGMKGGPLTAAAILYAPSLTLLGFISPMALKLKARSLEGLGVSAGNVYAIATVGSLAGALVTGFYLAAEFPAPAVLRAAAMLLMIVAIMGVMLGRGTRSGRAGATLLLGMILVSVTGSDGFAQAMTDLRNKPVLYTTQGRIEAKVIHHGPSPYGEIVVFDYGADHVRCLLLEGANESCWNFSARSPSEYTRHIAQLLKRFKTERSLRDVLVIGFGAGTLLKDLEGSGLNIEAVEINPKILEVGEAYFGAPQDIEYAVHIDDGRHFMTTTDRRYDAIVLDLCYVSSANVHLWTKEFYALAAARLNDPQRGVVIASRGTTDEPRSKELDHMIANAMRESFEHLYRVKRSEEGSGSFDMSVFVASGKELDAARGGPPELERWDFRPEYKAADDNSYQDLLELFWPATVAIRDQAAENFGKEILLPRL